MKVKRSKKKDSGGFLFLIKWIGYSDSENTWEPMSLLDDWDIEREQIYKFFEDENIDISGFFLNLILLTGSSRKKKKEMFLIRQAFLLMNDCVQRRYVVTKLT